ncbi:AMP-binding protein [Actinoplanes sp. NPDC026619]|uniref:class I adenylate-forming enzyme family protein n=1 Tax=Actinoplanes sp. NPDC026619 TaxID=3155798 RepID=UPI0034113FCF
MPPPTLAIAIRHTLQNHARYQGHRHAVIDRHGILTFSQLWRQARDLAAEHDQRPGKIIAVSATSDAAFFVRTAAIWLRGAVPMPVDPRTPQPLRESLTRRATIGAHTCRPWKATVGVASGIYRPLVTGGELPTVARKAHAVGLGTSHNSADPAASGVALFAAPMHLNGPFEFAVRHLLLGGSLAVLDRFAPQAWAQIAAATDASWAFLAPIQIGRLLEQVERNELRASTAGLRTLMHSAAPCPAHVRDRLLEVVDPHIVAEYYGAAEYDGTFTRADDRRPGGVPIAGAEFRVVDADRRPVAEGVAGTIEGRSTAGCSGHYAGAPCLPARAWRTVGDHGLLTTEGRLLVTGTASDGRAIVGGVNVAMARVHAVVLSHPSVMSCQVIAAPDDDYGQVLVARVIADRPLPADILHSYCADRLRPAERPRHLDITTPAHLASEDSDRVVSV